ncbi:hypothetical protein [Streptomyces sp. HUAS TT7]|uniref:hypothetical protein n=1 Tax=Streptomyces sp. HUAS TT7 TaxID=3447507 RepID=UPI003F65C60C
MLTVRRVLVMVLALALLGTADFALSGAAAVGPASADLRIASKRRYYNNNLPYGQSETITLYLYNAGPDTARGVTADVGYAPSMDYERAAPSVRRASVLDVRPSELLTTGAVRWGDPSSASPCVIPSKGDFLTCPLPDLGPEEMLELSVRFPMTHDTSYRDRTVDATVNSATADPNSTNNSTHYTITPNHGSDLSNTAYWNTPGDLQQLDPPGAELTAVALTDLRIASKRRYYNNNLPYGQSETITLYLANSGPAVARDIRVRAEYTHSLNYDAAAADPSVRGMTVPVGAPVSEVLTDARDVDWSPPERTAACKVDGWKLDCPLPDMGPQRALELRLTFPMTHEWSYDDDDLTASVTTSTSDTDPNNNSTRYTFTPNHGSDLSNKAYWNTPGELDQLDGSDIGESGRPCENGWSADTTAIVYEKNGTRPVTQTLSNLRSTLGSSSYQVPTLDKRGFPASAPATLTDVTKPARTDGYRLSFSLDDHPDDEQTYVAAPDTLLYLDPVHHPGLGPGPPEPLMGRWLPVRMLWPGAMVRGLSANRRQVTAHITRLRTVESGDVGSLLQPTVLSRSHSYVVGTADRGGIFTHNGGPQQCGPAKGPALLAGLQRLANRLVATTPPPTTTTPRPRPHLRPRPYPAPTPPPRRACPPPLPVGVPRRDEDGNWLIYLYEAATPDVVANARAAVANGAPWRLTYSPGVDRRRLSLRGSPAQSQLFNLSSAETQGPQGNRLGQLDRDEYPPNIAAEGGVTAQVMYIEATDNQDAGRLMGQQLQCYTGAGSQGGDTARPTDPPARVTDGRVRMQPGDTFRYAIIDEAYEVVEYLGDGYTDDTQIPPPPPS